MCVFRFLLTLKISHVTFDGQSEQYPTGGGNSVQFEMHFILY